jgi:hypothetical protein
VNPKLKGVLARATLVGGVALVASVVGRSAPHEQVIKVRFGGRAVSHVQGVVTRVGDDEPTAGFSRDFPGASDRSGGRATNVTHTFSAPNGTYIVVITLTLRPDRETDARSEGVAPIPTETSFERRVSLVGGELTVSPD